MATIKRTYYSKKLGKLVTKTYEYNTKKYTKKGTYVEGGKTKSLTSSTKLIDKKGNYKEGAIKALAKKTGVDTLTIKMTADYAQSRGLKVNVKSITGQLNNSIVERFLVNFDIDIEDLVKELQVRLPQENITMAWITDPSHWTNTGAYKVEGPLILPNGLGEVDFFWDYENGSTYEVNLNTGGDF